MQTCTVVLASKLQHQGTCGKIHETVPTKTKKSYPNDTYSELLATIAYGTAVRREGTLETNT